jgi:DNA repair photolyase
MTSKRNPKTSNGPILSYISNGEIMKLLKQGLTIRGDSLYCPLAFSLDSYSNCLTDCVHCYIRRLNEVWGKELRPLDIENFARTLHNGLKNPNPKSPLAWAIKQKKTIRFGNKADPFQDAEMDYGVSLKALKILWELKWDVVIESKFVNILWDDDYLDVLLAMGENLHMTPIITVGMEKDWIKLERTKTSHPEARLEFIKFLKTYNINVGVNGEPFIPGYHTVEQFEEMMKQLVKYGIPSYNTYNLHFNAFVARRLHAIGIDIEKVWYYNRDEYWHPILQQLIDIAKKYNIRLGCPDFVNAGWRYMETSNTCCGVNVQNPCTFNTMTWKREIQENKPLKIKPSNKAIFFASWDGVGDYYKGKEVFEGTTKDIYTMKDIKE